MEGKRFTIDKIFKEYPKLRDNETECFYHLVDNERNAEIFCERLNNLVEENEQLKSYIDTIFESNSHICKRLNIEDVQFYCERNRDYCYPSCTYKKCFDENNLIGLKDEIRRCNE